MAAKVQMIFEGDSKKVVDEMEKMRAKLRSVEGDLAKVKNQGKRTTKMFGGMGTTSGQVLGGMKSGFMSLIGPIASVGGAIATATKLLGEFNAEKERGAEGARGAFGGFQKLAQISADAQQFRGYVGTAAQLSLREGTPLPESLEAVFAGGSTNLTPQEMLSMSQFGRFSEIQPVYRGVGKLLASFGREEVGSALAGANKLGIAAKTSDISLAEFAPELATLGAPSRMIGVGDEEAMAALSVLSAGQGKTPEVAATQIRALMTAIRQSPRELGVRGAGSLAEMVRQIQTLPEAQRVKHFESNVRAASGLDALRTNLGAVEDLTGDLQWEGDISTGTPTSYMRSTARMFMKPHLTRALVENRRAAMERELSAMGAFGPGKLDFDTLVSRAYAALNDKDMSTIEQLQSRGNVGLYRFGQWLGLDTREGLKEYMGGLERIRWTGRQRPEDRHGVDITESQAGASLDLLNDALRENTEALRESTRTPATEDNRTQIFYGDPDERAQMRSPSGRRDPSIGR